LALLLALLALAALAVASHIVAVNGFEIFAQALDAIESLFAALTLALLALAESGLSLAHLIVQAIEAFGDSGLDGAGERPCALADPIGAALEQTLQIGVFNAGKGFAQLGGSIPLRRRQRAHGLTHLVLQTREVARGFLAILDELALFLHGWTTGLGAGPTGSAVGSGLAEHIGHAVSLRALFGGEAIGFASQRIELAGGLLLLFAAQQIGGFFESLGSATGVSFALRR
jgi:hypothetical protein